MTEIWKGVKEINKSVFLGTAAAEGIPNPVCGCPTCEMARKIKGKNIRERSVFRLSSDILIDFGPDFVAQAHKNNEDLTDLEHVLITHTHYDHFSAFALCQFIGSIVPPKSPVKFYLTGDAYEMAAELSNDRLLLKNGYRELLKSNRIKFEKLNFFEERKIGEYKIIPLPGRHPGTIETRSANYLIEGMDGKVIYYSTDTGYYYPETIEFLKNYQLDILITECTSGVNSEFNINDKHLSLTSVRLLLKKLLEQEIIGNSSRVYFTHFSHHHTMLHDDLQNYVSQWKEFNFPIYIAYDGMIIER
ncbi:MAG: MBL fold metallo-hydrolase [Muricoprocola sp.]